MLITAQQTNSRQTPRKLRLVANQVKNLPLLDAIRQLAVIERKSTLVLMKVVKQAIANAQHNHGLQLADLELKNILITEGPRYKRFNPVSRGRAHEIKKRTSHITVQLVTKEQKAAAKPTTSEAKAVAAK